MILICRVKNKCDKDIKILTYGKVWGHIFRKFLATSKCAISPPKWSSPLAWLSTAPCTFCIWYRQKPVKVKIIILFLKGFLFCFPAYTLSVIEGLRPFFQHLFSNMDKFLNGVVKFRKLVKPSILPLLQKLANSAQVLIYKIICDVLTMCRAVKLCKRS